MLKEPIEIVGYQFKDSELRVYHYDEPALHNIYYVKTGINGLQMDEKHFQEVRQIFRDYEEEEKELLRDKKFQFTYLNVFGTLAILGVLLLVLLIVL
jgi:hypothetical protein